MNFAVNQKTPLDFERKSIIPTIKSIKTRNYSIIIGARTHQLISFAIINIITTLCRMGNCYNSPIDLIQLKNASEKSVH